MDTKNNKRVYSKPVVQKPKEKIIKEQVEDNSIDPEIIEAKPVDPEVFETKLFVEEEPEEIKFEPHVEGKKVAEVLENYHNVDAVAEIEKALHKEMGGEQLGVDAEAELTKQLESAGAEIEFDEVPEPEKKIELIKGDKLTEKLKEVNKKIEEFQTVKVVPVAPEPEPMYTLTKEQEEEGVQAVADMVNNQIIEELKELGYEPKESVTENFKEEYLLTEKQSIDDSLSQHELRHFKRTDQLPK